MMEINISELEGILKIKTKAALNVIARDLINFIKIEAPVDTGRLRQSFQIIAIDDSTIYVGSNLNYAAKVYLGAEPHKPDFQSILNWTRRKLKADRGAAYAISKTIEKKGTKPNPYMDRAIDRLRAKYV